MAWTTPKTWANTMDRLNASNLNRYVRDNQLALRSDQAALDQRVRALGNRYSAVFAVPNDNRHIWVDTGIAWPDSTIWAHLGGASDDNPTRISWDRLYHTDWAALQASPDTDNISDVIAFSFGLDTMRLARLVNGNIAVWRGTGSNLVRDLRFIFES